MKRSIALVVIVGLLTGCAVTHTPSILVLPHGEASFDAFQADDAVCQQQAELRASAVSRRESQNSFGHTLLLGLAGAAVGASVGSRWGMAGYGAQVGATHGLARGTVYGAGKGEVVGQRAFDLTYAQCMRTKGHKLPGFQSIDDQPVLASVTSQPVTTSATPQPVTASATLQPVPTVARTTAPQCDDATVRAQCPLYQYRTGIYRASCTDGSGVEVGPGYVKIVPPPLGNPPHPWHAEGCTMSTVGDSKTTP